VAALCPSRGVGRMEYRFALVATRSGAQCMRFAVQVSGDSALHSGLQMLQVGTKNLAAIEATPDVERRITGEHSC